MTRTVARPLLWLGTLLAVYLCAPFIASIPEIGHADWAGVDWPTMGSAVGVSVGSASVAALIILIGGVPLGYWLARSSSRAVAVLGFVVQLPLALPPLTSGVLLLFLLGPYSWFGRLAGGMLTDSFAGVVFAETFVAAPFLVIAARSAFAAVDPVYDDVAATLGHHAGSRFFRVTLPVAWPAIRAGLALAWLRAFGEFGATVMVAYHPYSLPVYTYVVFGGQGLPAMMPLLLPTLAIAVLCAVLSVYRRAPRADADVELLDNGELDLAARAPEQRQIGYMPQDYGLFPHMTVAQQLAFPVDADASSARYWLEHLGLAALTRRLPHQLSFGQRQRVALARALTRHSQLLLFDEPFAALDTPRRRRLQQSLRALQREIDAVTVVVTHDPDEAALLADEVLIVEQGRVLQAGTIGAVFERPASSRVAELLGLHNVGDGVVRADGCIETPRGLVLDSALHRLPEGLTAGQRVMWRVSPRAIGLAGDGGGPGREREGAVRRPAEARQHDGTLVGIELRHGDRYAVLDIGGHRFDIACDDSVPVTAGATRFSIDPHGVSVWPHAME